MLHFVIPGKCPPILSASLHLFVLIFQKGVNMAEVEIAAEALPEDSMAAPESLSFSVAIIGSGGSGKTTLVRSLCHQTEQFGPKFLESYFKREEGSHEAACHTYPSLPNVTLLDYPGYNAGDSPTAYLDGIKLENVHCLVLTVGEVISDADLQILGALKQLGKPYCVVQTHVDLILHTEKRQQGKNYWRGQTLLGLRGKAEERLGGSGPQGAHIFLVSCLEAMNFDFVEMVDHIEKEWLQWKR